MTAATWRFILFVAGHDTAVEKLYSEVEQICEKHLSSPYSIELVNIMEMPEKAYEFDIIATPTLLRKKPEPKKKIVGSLSQTSKVLIGLGLTPDETME